MGRFEGFIGVDFWTALFVLLNTLAIFFVAKKYLFKPVHKLISDRQNEIDGMYQKAEACKKEAEEQLDELSKRLEKAQSESDRIVSEAVKRAEKRESDILSRAKSEAQGVLEKARLDAEREKKQALSDAKSEISSLALSIAEKVVQREVNQEDNLRLADSFIDRLGEGK